MPTCSTEVRLRVVVIEGSSADQFSQNLKVLEVYEAAIQRQQDVMNSIETVNKIHTARVNIDFKQWTVRFIMHVL